MRFPFGAGRPGSRVVTLAGLALIGPMVVVMVTGPGVAAGAASAGPVEEARQAARLVPFSARLEVSWVDRSGVHTAEMGVRAVGGSVRVNGPGGGGDRSDMVLQASALSPATGAGDLLAPALERKYDVERTSGPTVAGRETDLFVLRSGGEIREQLAIDRDSGLVLRREVYGPDGKPVRRVTVLQLDTAPVPGPGDTGSGTAESHRTVRVASLPSVYRGPAALAGGYRRVAAYRRDRIVHLLYTDGLHGMSLFSQPGTLSAGSLPSGGTSVRVGASSGIHYTWSGGDVVTWQTGSVVHTLVGDGTATDLLTAARSMPRTPRPDALARLRGTSRLVAELVSGGR